jgi:hypothetical protein
VKDFVAVCETHRRSNLRWASPARMQAKEGKLFKDYIVPGVTAVVAVIALYLSVTTQQQSALHERRALADFVVFQDVNEPGPSTAGTKPSVETTFVVANWGPLPIENAQVEGGSTPLFGHATYRYTPIGTVGPCEVATIPGTDATNPAIVFTDANGGRWSRRPAKAPRKAVKHRGVGIKDGGVELESDGGLDIRALRHCQT